ncbi:aldolase [Salinicola corii]|uniref:3-oxo-tetronate 4-phosphate decarboxylase n=1 Tax=Salinicola corii TaxID=2606937 RepID=A0A640WFA3_9GAMM|nr:aldolase [Salinicola corii]KAA0018804.1 aldolase [Salinicola corii]
MNEHTLRQRLVTLGKRLYDRGLSPGTSGNLSVRLEDGWLTTPTNSCMGELNADEISKLDWEGNVISGSKPSKEYFFHLAYYKNRPQAQAIVHLHSTYSSAVSCLKNLDDKSILPPITPYFVMRIGQLPLVPYRRPGDARLGDDVARLAPHYSSLMLANHGPIVTGRDFDSTVSAAEELEETARLFLLLHGHEYRVLDDAAIDELREHFGVQWES